MFFITLCCALTAGAGSGESLRGPLGEAQDYPVPGAVVARPMVGAQAKAGDSTGEKADPTQLSGIVVDASGGLLARAEVQVRSADGSIRRTTQTDGHGAFTLLGLAPGTYRLSVSRLDFDVKEVFVVVRSPEAQVPLHPEMQAPLRIALTVRAVSTTVDVQGRENDLTGIADSATQGTVGAGEIRDRPMLRSGEVLETVPGVIITQHAGGGKANQYFLRGFNLDHGTDFAVFLDEMPLNLPSHAHGEGYADMNAVIPEFVGRVNYEKGPYYAEVGNYS